MSKAARVVIAFTLVLAILGGSLTALGCGEGEKAALEMPTFELYQFQRGATSDFDEATINSAANAEANVKYGTAKAIYQSVWAANQEGVANQLFPPPYWKGDGVTTKYASLASGDQTTVDATIFATKLSQAEQDIVANAVNGMFATYDEELAAAKALEQNTAYGILYMTDNTGGMSTAWKTDAAAWMTALNAYASANYGGKTFAALTWAERQTVMAAVFNKGAGTINPEYAFWRAMVKNSFKYGVASSMNPTVRDGIALSQFGKAYTALDCVQGPTVDAMVWYSLSTDNQAVVEGAVAGMLMSQATLDGVFAAKGMTSAQAGFDAEVTNGTNMELAFYKWLAYESFRNGTVSSYYPTQLTEKVTAMYPGKTYATLTKCEQMAVAGALWASLGAAEQGFGGSVVAGLWGLVQAETTDAVAIDQTTLVRGPTGLQAATGTETAVQNWKKDVEGGLAVTTAYYRWLAKESLLALRGLGTLIRLSQAEFLFKVTNPNKYAISIDSAQFYFYVNSTALSAEGTRVDTAKVAMNDKIWVPAETELLVKVVAPVKVMDMVTWAVMGGQQAAAAQKLAGDVWAQYQAGTQTWIITIDAYVSDDEGENTVTASFSL
ncbi:MAG: hypothetical protein QUS33_08385 [Dehalococcoidia bacterium]|nr:hypothetical protein [Dehalococcoidia bacterium]